MDVRRRVIAIAIASALCSAPAGAQVLSPWPPRLPATGVGTGPVNGGRVHAIAVHPSNNRRIVVGTEFGGLWRTTDGGTTWTHLPSLDNVFVEDVAYANGGAVLVVTAAWDVSTSPSAGRGGVWTSDNDGSTWTRVVIVPPGGGARGPARPGAYGIAVAPDNPAFVVVGTDYGIVMSTDGGIRWIADAIPTGSAVDADRRQDAAISVLPFAGGRVLATLRSGLWLRALDGTWSNLRGGDATAAGRRALAPWPRRADVALFLDLSAVPTLRTYDLAANRWSEVRVPPSPIGRGPLLRVGLDPAGGTMPVIWLGVPPNLLRAPCATLECVPQLEFESWTYTDRGSHADPGDIGLDADLRPVLYGNDGGLFRPADASARTWTLAAPAAALNTLQISSLNATYTYFPRNDWLYFSTQDNGTWSSADGGATWTWRDCEGWSLETRRHATSQASVSYGQAGCTGSGARQADGNLERVRDLSNRPGGALLRGTAGFAIADRGWMRMAVSRAGTSQDLYSSIDDGLTWRLRALVPFAFRGSVQAGGSGVGHIAYVPYRFDVTGRDAWGSGIGLLRIDQPLDARVDWIVGTAPGILRLPGGGSLGTRGTMFDWRAVFAVNPSNPLHVIAPDVVNGVIWVTRNGGMSWDPDSALLSEVTRGGALRLYTGDPYHILITSIAFDPLSPNRIFVGTRDAGIVYSSDDGASWLRIPGSERIRYITGFVPRRDSRVVIVSSYGHGLWLFDPGAIRLPFVRERMCYGIRCFVRLPPDAEQTASLDWKQLEVIVAAGGRIAGLRGENDVVTAVEVSEKAAIARFVPPDLDARPLDVQIVDKPSSFGPWKAFVDRIDKGETIVGVALQDGRVAALITADAQIPAARLDETLKDAAPLARANPASQQKSNPPAASQAQPSSSDAARDAAQRERIPILITTKEASGGVAAVTSDSVVEVTATGFIPPDKGGAPVRIEIDDRVVVKETVVEKDGFVRARVPVAPTLPIGPHTLRVVQTQQGGDRMVTEGFVKVPEDRR